MKTSRRRILFTAALCLAQTLTLAGCESCSQQADKTEAAAAPAATATSSRHAQPPLKTAATLAVNTAADPTHPGRPLFHGVEVRPRENSLSAEAASSAAYLALLQSISKGDENGALAAAQELAKASGANTLPSAQWLECALWFMERNSVNAIPFLRSARASHPEDVPLLLAFAEALGQHNFSTEALAALTEYSSHHPENNDVLLQTGITQLKLHKTADALATFNSVKGKHSGLFEYYYARALAESGKDEEALKHLRLATKELPRFGEALAELAFLSEKRGDYKEARQAYEKLLKMDFSRKDISLRLINLALKMNEPDKAAAYYRQGPDDIFFKLTSASLFLESKHYLQAETILKTVAARPDAPSDVFLFLADLTFEQRHDLAAALKWLEKIPDSGGFAQRKVLLTAQLQAEAGQNDVALATVRNGQAQFPEAADFVNMEARILSRSGKPDEAIAAVRAGLKHWPDSTDLSFLLGNLLSEKGERKEAFVIMEGILKKEPENFQALNYVGYTLAEENRDIARALELLTKANALAPKQFFILDSLAWAHYRAGHLEEAWTYIREAARLDTSSDATIQEHYGDIAVSKGLKTEAKAAYKKALDKKPPNAEDIRKRLEAL